MEKIKVNQDQCIGCGACVALASEVFNFNDEGFAETIDNKNNLEEMDDELKEAALDALEGCPTSAIYKEDEEKEDEEKN